MTLLQCNVCGQGVVAQYVGKNAHNWLLGHETLGDTELVQTYPVVAAANGPSHLPSNVAGYYDQGTDNFRRKHWDAAGTMFRKALDVGLRQLHASNTGNLFDRINTLPEEIGVTPAMKEWAHQIRKLGNDAAHEDEPFTGDDAKDLYSFTELFLTYAFSLPAMLKERKEKTS